MLEHAYRHDAVEPPRLARCEVGIVDQLEFHAVGDPRRLGAAARERELLFGQGDAEHLDRLELRERDRHPAPAAADVEHPLPRRERQLRRDMRLLGDLRSEEHTSELQSLMRISYAVFCLKKKKHKKNK